jgi:hypothetical protein
MIISYIGVLNIGRKSPNESFIAARRFAEHT